VGALDIEWENNSDNASGNATWSIDIFTYGFSIIYVSQRNSDNASGNAAWSIDIFTYGFSIIYVSQRNLR